MKAVLEFNLDDEHDDMLHRQCVNAKGMVLSLWDIAQHMRSITKYAPDSMSQETYDELMKVRNEINEIMNGYNISLDDLLK